MARYKPRTTKQIINSAMEQLTDDNVYTVLSDIISAQGEKFFVDEDVQFLKCYEEMDADYVFTEAEAKRLRETLEEYADQYNGCFIAFASEVIYVPTEQEVREAWEEDYADYKADR